MILAVVIESKTTEWVSPVISAPAAIALLSIADEGDEQDMRLVSDSYRYPRLEEYNYSIPGIGPFP